MEKLPVGKDLPIETNKRGGRQAAVPYRLDLIDPVAILALARVLCEGAKKHDPNNWRKIDINDHLNHALVHIYAYLAGDNQDDHLSHAFCRLMMATALNEKSTAEGQTEGEVTSKPGDISTEEGQKPKTKLSIYQYPPQIL